MKKEDFYYVGNFYHGLARAHEKLTGMWVYVDQNYNIAFPQKFNSAGDFNENGQACVTKFKTYESGLEEISIFYIDTKGIRQSLTNQAIRNYSAEISAN